MSENNVSNIFRVFLGSLLGLCCAIFSVPVKANYNNLTWSEIATGFRDMRGVPGATENFERITNTSGAYSSLPNNSNYRGGITLSGTFTSPSKRIPYKGAAILRPNPVTMATSVGRLLTSNPYVFVGSLAFATFNSQNGFIFNESSNQLTKAPDGFDADSLAAIIDEVPLFTSRPSGVVAIDSYPTKISTQRRPEDIPAWLGDYIPISLHTGYSGGQVQVRACAPSYDLMPFVGHGYMTGSLAYSNDCYYARDFDAPPPFFFDISKITLPVKPSDLPDPANFKSYDGFFSEANLMPIILSETPAFKPDGKPDFNLNFEVPSGSIDLGSSVSTSVADGVTTTKETSSKLDLDSKTSGDLGESGSVVEKEITETKTYVDGQLVETEVTEEDTENAVLPVPPSVDLELPEGCALFDPFCKWAEWTQQDLDEEEPDFSLFINDFEPEEDSYTLDLGGTVCPAPISVNLGFLNTNLELSYEPACDLMTMIRPLILASAYLLAAYIYLGVLRG